MALWLVNMLERILVNPTEIKEQHQSRLLEASQSEAPTVLLAVGVPG